MANPRRSSINITINPSSPDSPTHHQHPPLTTTVTHFLKRPQAFPILLTLFVLLTWVSLRLSTTHSPTLTKLDGNGGLGGRGIGSGGGDAGANLVRFSSLQFPSQVAKDSRGWLLNPVSAASQFGVSGGAQSCSSVHVGQIQPGGVRGNHRHHTCNETFIIWGAETKFRLENAHAGEKGYAEVIIGAEEVAIAASPNGTAHALVNVDHTRTTYFLGCQDNVVNYNSSTTDFNVWKDL